MRVLLVSDHAAPTGGAEVLMLRLRASLRARGHDARLLSTRAALHGVPSQADYTCFGTSSAARLVVRLANPSAARELRRVLADFRPDVVHVGLFLNQLSPSILPALARVPSLYHVVWYRPVCPIGTKLRPDGAICHEPPGLVCVRCRCVPLAAAVPVLAQMAVWRRRRGAFSAIVACSEAVRSRLLAEGIGPVEVIRHGVPLVDPRPPLAGPPTAAFAGRLRLEKGAEVLLRAFGQVLQRVPDARLLLVGDGERAAAVRALAARLGLADRVSLPGHLPGAELERTLGAAWAQALPGLWEDPLPLVALEAMMRGTAVVASRSGGLVEVVREGETGLLVPPGDVTALADALARVLGDRTLAERFGAAARVDALAGLQQEQLVERLLERYETLVAAGPVRPGARRLPAVASRASQPARRRGRPP